MRNTGQGHADTLKTSAELCEQERYLKLTTCASPLLFAHFENFVDNSIIAHQVLHHQADIFADDRVRCLYFADFSQQQQDLGQLLLVAFHHLEDDAQLVFANALTKIRSFFEDFSEKIDEVRQGTADRKEEVETVHQLILHRTHGIRQHLQSNQGFAVDGIGYWLQGEVTKKLSLKQNQN